MELSDEGNCVEEEKASLLPSNETRTRATCCGGIQDEFRLKNIFLEYEGKEAAFYTSQWHWPAVVFVLYRIVAAAYITTWLLITALGLIHGKEKYLWSVWLTNWSYLALSLHLILAAILAVCATWQDGSFRWCSRLQTFDLGPSTLDTAFETDTRRLPWYIKLDWILFNIVCLAAFTVTLVYFIGLYPQMGVIKSPLILDINLHGMNLVVVILELTLGAIPIRLLHVIYPILYGVVYIIFSLIYWSGDHSRVLYPKILDWNHPGATAVIVTCLLFLGIPLLQMVIFSIYKIKLCVYRRMYCGNTYARCTE